MQANDFGQLSDYEFEALGKDIMSRTLNMRLERFPKGGDGGIDLTDNSIKPKVIIQIKHYPKTPFTTLLRELKKEVSRIEEIQPDKYYVFCSKELSRKNKVEIYNIFKKYMHSPDNIISGIDINDFLDSENNVDILKKHYKLWIHSSGILQNFLNRSIQFESEYFFQKATEDLSLFAETFVYSQAVDILNKQRALMVIGNPGVGKSITSEMVALKFAVEHYEILFTTDISNIASLKNAISVNPDKKQLIVLDDCFGQAYFNMKESQSSELSSLIRYISRSKNKLLILNSRITIFNEAEKLNRQIQDIKEKRVFEIFTLDLSDMPLFDKAKILYNHIYHLSLPDNYFNSIKKNRNYLKIVSHKNFNPRIIEYVTKADVFCKVEPDFYSEFILKQLDNPEKVWEEEYENRIALPDRILLSTLYSLTNTISPRSLVESCFNERIKTEKSIDQTLNNFKASLARLNNSLVKNVIKNKKEYLSVANPSINDFLRERLRANILERKCLIEASQTTVQYERLLPKEEYLKVITSLIVNQEISKKLFLNETQKAAFIAEFVISQNIKMKDFQNFVYIFLLEAKNVSYFENSVVVFFSFLEKLFSNKNLLEYYDLLTYLNSNPNSFEIILKNLELEELIAISNLIISIFSDNSKIYQIISSLILQGFKSEFSGIVYYSDGYDDAVMDKLQDNEHLSIQDAEELVAEDLQNEEERRFEDFIEQIPDNIADLISFDLQINYSSNLNDSNNHDDLKRTLVEIENNKIRLIDELFMR